MHSLLHIDWLSITIPLSGDRDVSKFEDLQLWDSLDGKTMTKDGSKWHVSAPQYGYTHAYTSLHGTIAMFGRTAMGLHVIYSGQCLQRLTSEGIDTDDIIRNAAYFDARCTRIDVALDIIDGRNKVSNFQLACERAQCVTSSKTWRIMQGSEGGHTLYVGSRSSERMVRVYDKKAQLAAKYEQTSYDNWVRIECEFKGDKAKNLMRACSENDLIDVMTSHLIDAVDFPTIPEYGQALNTGGKFVEPTITKRKDTQTRHWLMKMVAPVIAREAAQDGEFYAALLTEVNAQIENLLKGKG